MTVGNHRSELARLREQFHRRLCRSVLGLRGSTDVPSNADRDSKQSVAISKAVLAQIACEQGDPVPSPQRSGRVFEEIVLEFLRESFAALRHLRPGKWVYTAHAKITDFVQYEHLKDLASALREHPQLRATLGDYLVKPDLVVAREPVDDHEINVGSAIVDEQVATLTPLRAANQSKRILHASISCKWTIRSDRSQNARTEALNLLRNRKGAAPHVVIVTAEPLPSRLASVALGTGDVDCVYHFALYELQTAVKNVGDETSQEMLQLLINGKRLRDISDLPFDLAT